MKTQTSETKNFLDKTNHSYNKCRKNQIEYSEPNNEQNESALCDVPYSSSCQDTQGQNQRNAYKLLTLQRKKVFPKQTSSTMANQLNPCTNFITKLAKRISIEHLSSSEGTEPCFDSPDTVVSKSSASVRKNDVKRESNLHHSLTFSKFSYYFRLFFCKSIISIG